ncbi:MAG: hypothetical protein LBH81_02800 [Rickettsiales bacterium]|jgi:hypothetical protein|nr:hypothetical protein [Rickettsiales bacterium]
MKKLLYLVLLAAPMAANAVPYAPGQDLKLPTMNKCKGAENPKQCVFDCKAACQKSFDICQKSCTY